MAEALVLQAGGGGESGNVYTLNCVNHVVMGYQTGGEARFRLPIGFLTYTNADASWRITAAGKLSERSIRYSAIGGGAATEAHGFSISLSRLFPSFADVTWYRQNKTASQSCGMMQQLLITFPAADNSDRGLIGLLSISGLTLIED